MLLAAQQQRGSRQLAKSERGDRFYYETNAHANANNEPYAGHKRATKGAPSQNTLAER